MRVLLFGKKSVEIKSLVQSLNLEIVKKDPEVVVTYGGDGTLLSSEVKFPSIPKLGIRDNAICIKCQNHKDEVVLQKLKGGTLKLSKINKLEGEILGRKILATNDFVIRNTLQMHAIRFNAFKNGKQINNLIIGDGIVATTTFGSTGYFQSITRTSFQKGLGLAFNNTTENLQPIYFCRKDIIKIVIVRGPATLTYDNSLVTFKLEGGSEITFKESPEKLLIYESSINCNNCKVTRDH